ncbi:MAG: ABC transporter ATP-binding protein [Clostridia bacterium]|nr:ABC transporter ATP-binding protein [Clostridia bacterium]
MSRPRGAMHISKRPKDTKGTLSRLLSYIFGSYRLHLAAVLIFIIISSVTGVRGSMFVRTVLDNYVTPMLKTGSRDFSPLFLAVLQMLGIYVAGVLSTFLYNRIMIIVGQGVLRDIRDDMFAKMQKLPLSYFDTHSHGDTMSRYTNDADTLRQMITQSIPHTFSSVITIISVLVAMISTSIPLTLVVLCIVALILLVSKKITGRSSGFFVAQQKSLGGVNGFIEEHINGQKVVKVFCHEEKAKADFDKLNEELCQNATNANVLANILMPIMGNLGHLQYVLLAMAGGILAILGVPGITVGIIAAFLQLSRSFTMPISHMSQQINSIIMALAGAERIFELVDESPETYGGTVSLVKADEVDGKLSEVSKRTGIWAWKKPLEDGTYSYTRLSGDVLLENVNFGYTPEKTVLHDISIFAKPGQKIALVGATGAGKTTITNLLTHFYDINDGKIFYDGINISDIKKSDLRMSLGMVLQDTHLFTGTVMENIRYGRLDATDEEVYEAARLANADGFIRMLSDGYNTVLKSGGEGLSQGQRQLLAIARAAIADPPVMILDEATSSIDTRTERIVQKGMDSLMQGRTVFVIAHRLSTIQNSDVIMVMDGGKIIERGDHDKLIAERGRYYSLYTGSFDADEE